MSWIEDVYNHVPRNLSPTLRLREPVKEYATIVEAIEAGDSELAGKLMSEHVLHGSRARAEYYPTMPSA